jgi:hypothetical protein
MIEREVWVFCDCSRCPNEANLDDLGGMNLCAECAITYLENGKLINKGKYGEDGDPYMED